MPIEKNRRLQPSPNDVAIEKNLLNGAWQYAEPSSDRLHTCYLCAIIKWLNYRRLWHKATHLNKRTNNGHQKITWNKYQSVSQCKSPEGQGSKIEVPRDARKPNFRKQEKLRRNRSQHSSIHLSRSLYLNPKVGQDQMSGGASVLCLHAAPVSNALWKPQAKPIGTVAHPEIHKYFEVRIGRASVSCLHATSVAITVAIDPWKLVEVGDYFNVHIC